MGLKDLIKVVALSLVIIILYTIGIVSWQDNAPNLTYLQMLKRNGICEPNIYRKSDRLGSVNDSLTVKFDEDRLIPGGRYTPPACDSLQRIAIIVPFRNRDDQLPVFLRYMHTFLQRQNLEYTIFVIEQTNGSEFNRGLLMNVGFHEATRQYDYDCFIFHDVDLLPENDQIQYTCGNKPKHLSVAISSKNYKMPYKSFFGGVCAISRYHFKMINGFSNVYFGWGGEDDDIKARLKFRNLKVERPPTTVGRYKMLPHTIAEESPMKNTLYKKAKARYLTDGLNSLEYSLEKYELKRLYTWILVSVNETQIMNKTFHNT